ncbi:hypothetical protein F511_47411 [Dorcoceras hygrometricum]|uniref:Uncharacterized protein n=1 Tax=Dorcoceras hygrometricum TaxID=472368 RepID=A0A2Z6ZR34_9LAMI|nr:hypothetical protein F511_47411 [Dorcoceras hygrometricum]
MCGLHKARSPSRGARLPCATSAQVARVHARDMEGRLRKWRLPMAMPEFWLFRSEKLTIRYNKAISY